MAEWAETFKQRFCKRYHCPEARYVPVATRKVLPWYVRLLRPLIHVLHPDHFHIDFELLDRIGHAQGWGEVNAALGAFNSNNRMRGGFYRNTLKFRVSGRRVSRMVRQLMGEPPRNGN